MITHRCASGHVFGLAKFRPWVRTCLDPTSSTWGEKTKAVVQTGPTGRKKKYERIEMRGLNLMRSMQQGISTHYNTRFGI